MTKSSSEKKVQYKICMCHEKLMPHPSSSFYTDNAMSNEIGLKKSAERTENDFRCTICYSAIGQDANF